MRITRMIVQRRGWIALLWVVAAVVFLPAAGHVAEVLDVGARVEGSESAAVERILTGPLATPFARFAVLVVAGSPPPDSPEGAELLRRIVDTLERASEVSETYSYLDRSDSLFLAPGNTGTFVVIGLAVSPETPDRVVARLRAVTARVARDLEVEYPDVALRWTGEAALNVDLRRTSGQDVEHAERRALPITTVFLLFAFGTVAAALLPVFSGALSIAIALGAAALLARLWPLSLLLQSVVSMLGLGLGIDYALLIVSRFREALAAGESVEAAAESAARHAGHTILLSAATVALGFAVLLTVPLNEIRAIAVGGLLVVIASALLATTLMPGVLAWCGRRIEWGRVRRRRAGQVSIDHWRRLGHWVTGHPWIALVAGASPLVLLAVQAGRMETGLPRGNWLPPEMESAQGLDDLRRMGHSGVIQRVRIVLEFPAETPVKRSAGWRALDRFAESLERDARVRHVRSVVGVAREAGMGRSAFMFLPKSMISGLVSADGRHALVEVLPHESVGADAMVGFVRDVRRAGATASGIAGVRVLTGGLPAFNADYQDAVAGRFWSIVALVVGGTFLALVAGFRSVLVPLKAVLLNLLSVAASFGALTLVFQEGHGAAFFGVAEPLGAVFSSLPLIVFCIVFGLSMDYEVFLMTRVMEGRHAGLSDRGAIVEALGTTGQVITNAAAIMLVVFAAFTTSGFLMLKMLGFALAVAVLVDATLVRTIVGPALLQLAGRWNWWPGWRRPPMLPRVGSE
jgi:RND superfamily putative drug exporter